MKLLFVGPLWNGSTALQRLRAFEELSELTVSSLDSLETVDKASLIDRVRHRLRWPKDKSRLNDRLIAATEEKRPEVVFIDSSRVLLRGTLETVKRSGATVVFYSPDDVAAPHNSSRQLEGCDRVWDVFFTTKTFNLPELRARGVARPVLVGKSYDPVLHRPMTRTEVGAEFEAFDTVFVGTAEAPRLRSMNHLAESGIRIGIYGNGWSRGKIHRSIELHTPQYGEDYTRALHAGKLALCFLRRMNRDKVTQRSVELPASGRAMVAEKTVEHDELFLDGHEYVSFSTDAELVERVHELLRDEHTRQRIALCGRERCVASGYSTVERAHEMLRAIQQAGQ